MPRHSLPLKHLVLALTSCVVFTAFAHVPPAHATDTTYVRNSPCDYATPRGSAAHPFCSVKAALDSTDGTNRLYLVLATGSSYREAVTIDDPADAGVAGQPCTIRASGAVTFDGSDFVIGWTKRWVAPDTARWLWIRYAPNVTVGQVIKGGIYYPRQDTIVTLEELHVLPTGQSADVGDTVYVNAGSQDWASSAAYLCTRIPFRIRIPYVVIDGFNIINSRACGVLIDPASPIYVPVVLNCTITHSGSDGVDMRNTTCGIVTNNTITYSQGHGIFLQSVDVESCTVTYNTCAYNDDYKRARGGKNGIRIGSDTTIANIGGHEVFNNKVHDNEDSGIEIHGSDYVFLRYNQSWHNGDHGYDHNYCHDTKHVGDLAWGNQRDGMSFEETTYNNTVRNCIIADNGRDACRYDYELETFTKSQSGWNSDYNIIWRPSRSDSDNVIIHWNDFDSGTSCPNSKCTQQGCYTTLAAFQGATVGFEDSSTSAEPTFVSGESGNFIPLGTSPVIDGADATIAGYLSTDVRGFARYDVPTVPNHGAGTPNYADIGPFEFNPAPPACQDVAAGATSQYSLQVEWEAPADDGSCTEYDLRYSTSQITAANFESANRCGIAAPQSPGSAECNEIRYLFSVRAAFMR